MLGYLINFVYKDQNVLLFFLLYLLSYFFKYTDRQKGWMGDHSEGERKKMRTLNGSVRDKALILTHH